MVGRDDGSLEVWDVDPSGQAQLMASAQLPESITAVGGGYITNAGSPDIIVQTFTGKVRSKAWAAVSCGTHSVQHQAPPHPLHICALCAPSR